jgi:hypothetical protein
LEAGEWIGLAMNRDRRRDFVVKEMNLLRLAYNADNFLSIRENASFSIGTCSLELSY